MFAALAGLQGTIGSLFNIEAYRSLETLPINDFAEKKINALTYQGGIGIGTDNNYPTYLYALANSPQANAENQILISGAEYDPSSASHLSSSDGDDLLLGGSAADSLEGGSGSDTLAGTAGDDILVGDGPGATLPNQDLLYGGTGKNQLTGDKSADTFIFSAEDGSSEQSQASVIVDFEAGVDQLGLIGLTPSDVTFVGDATGAYVMANGNYLALLEGVSVEEIQRASEVSGFYNQAIDSAMFEIE